MSPWRPIATAPTDGTEIWVYAAAAHGLKAFCCKCAYHPDGGFCCDELREATLWMPLEEAIQTKEWPPNFCCLADGPGRWIVVNANYEEEHRSVVTDPALGRESAWDWWHDVKGRTKDDEVIRTLAVRLALDLDVNVDRVEAAVRNLIALGLLAPDLRQ